MPRRDDERTINDRHPEAPERSEGHRKSAVADLRTHDPISGKPGIGGRRPICCRESSADHPSRLATLAPQDDGSLIGPVGIRPLAHGMEPAMISMGSAFDLEPQSGSVNI